MFGFFGGGYPGGPGGGTFEANYRAMPVAFIDKQSAEYGDKVILPPSALERLASLHIEYPMLFKLEGMQSGRHTHCGVLEFVAEEGVIYMPHWMMQNLLLQVGDMVKVRNVSLPKGTFVKLQPATADFLDISNPKAVLERTLRGYTCLTVGDCFVVNYNNKNYEIEVREARPAKAISVIETDCEVDFEAPKDYKEPEPVRPPPAPAKAEAADSGKAGGAGTSAAAAAAGGAGAAPAEANDEPPEPTFLAFAGTGRRLDGKPAGPSAPVPVPQSAAAAAAAARFAAASGASTSAASGSKPALSSSPTPAAASGTQKSGTRISFGPSGNRLTEKLAKEKDGGAGAGGGGVGGAKPPAPSPEPDKEAAEEDKFKAFIGKGYSLKG